MTETELKAFYAEIQTLMDLITDREMDEALDQASRLVAAHPDRAEPYHLLGLISFFFHDRGRALELLEKAHQLAPEVRDYADALANIYARVNKQADGLYFAKLATTLAPHDFFPTLLPDQFRNYFQALSEASLSYHYPNALTHFSAHKIQEAAYQCEMELRLNADHHAAHALLGQCYLLMNEPYRARMAFQVAISLAPENAVYRTYLGESLTAIGLYDQAIQSLKKAFALDENSPIVRQSAMACLPYFPKEYRDFVDQCLAPLAQAGDDLRKMDAPDFEDPDAPIHIGFITSQGEQSSEYAFFAPYLTNSDGTRFQIHVFHNSTNHTTAAKHLLTHAESWDEVFDVDDDTLLAIMAGNQIDVLIDMDGTLRSRRSAVLAAQPAATILSWPTGHPLDGIPGCASFHEALKDYEALKYWPISREPMTLMEPSGKLPALERGYITFGALADPRMLTAAQVALWSQMLLSIPGAQIRLAWRGPISAETATYISDMFNDNGAGKLVSFHRHIPGDPLSAFGADYFNEIDIVLDTHPNCDAELITEALWMGVPAITYDGADGASVGPHILGQAGRAEWIASSPDAFMTIAQDLCANIKTLSSLRKTMRDELSDSKLFSPKRAVKDFQDLVAHLMKAQSA